MRVFLAVLLGSLVLGVHSAQAATSPEQCFARNVGGFVYHYLDVQPPFYTDALLVVRHRGSNPYGPQSYRIQLETAPNVWRTIATTLTTGGSYQENRFIISAAVLKSAYNATGWVRMRNANVYTGPTGNCVQVSLTVNCEYCLSCPYGTLDLGIGCQPVNEPYTFDPFNGQKSCDWDDTRVDFLGVPEALEAGTLNFDWGICDSGTVRVEVLRGNRWELVTQASADNACGFISESVSIPRPLLNAAITADHKLKMRFSYRYQCAGGCSRYQNCLQNLSLSFARSRY